MLYKYIQLHLGKIVIICISDILAAGEMFAFFRIPT